MFASANKIRAVLSETGDSENDIYYAQSTVLNCDPAVEVDVCDTCQLCTERHRKKESLFQFVIFSFQFWAH